MSEKPEITSKRKADHLDICLNQDVSFSRKTSGFERYSFEHYAITEANYDGIDLSTNFLDRKIDFPFMISCMTGGAKESESINKQLSETAIELNIPLGVGSQRQALKSNEFIESYRTIKETSKKIPVLGNIGASQVAKSVNPCELAERLIDMINASALVVHVNPLQELMQKEGETDFSGLLDNIREITKKIKVPVFIKEVGAGISGKTAKALLKVNVKGIDVAGAGGTSWSQVELKRNNIEDEFFRNWGIPTAECLEQIAPLKKDYQFTLIASGGITNGIYIAKSLALGADLAASANPILKALYSYGKDGLKNMRYDLV